MKNITLVVLVISCLITCFGSITYALPAIELTEIDISDNIFIGDIIDVSIDFSVASDRSELVRLSLYIDNKIKDTYSSFYPDGDFSFTFHYDTDHISRGEHEMKIKAEIIRDDEVRDSDTQIQTFELKKITSDIYHNTQITQMNYPLKAPMNSKVPITLTIQNDGVVDESSLQTKITLNSKTYKSDYFYLERDSKKSQTIYITTPMDKGEYEIIIETKNPYVMDKKTIVLTVEDISLILKTDAVNISEEKYVFIYGYVREEKPRQNYVYLYKDNKYSVKIMPESDGYFSYFLKFDEPGEHIITAKIYGLREDIKINTFALPEEKEETPVENKTTFIPNDEDIENKTPVDEQPKETNNHISGQFIKKTELPNIMALFLLFVAIIILSCFAVGYHHVKPIPWNGITQQKPKETSKEEGFLEPSTKLFPKAAPLSNLRPVQTWNTKARDIKAKVVPKIAKEEETIDVYSPAHWVSYRNMVK